MDREKEKEKVRRRRHHKARIRNKARQHAKHTHGFNERQVPTWPSIYLHKGQELPSREEYIQDQLKMAERMAETRPRCSCFMCGNPRRKLSGSERLTLKEKKDLDKMNDQLEDVV